MFVGLYSTLSTSLGAGLFVLVLLLVGTWKLATWAQYSLWWVEQPENAYWLRTSKLCFENEVLPPDTYAWVPKSEEAYLSESAELRKRRKEYKERWRKEVQSEPFYEQRELEDEIIKDVGLQRAPKSLNSDYIPYHIEGQTDYLRLDTDDVTPEVDINTVTEFFPYGTRAPHKGYYYCLDKSTDNKDAYSAFKRQRKDGSRWLICFPCACTSLVFSIIVFVLPVVLA